MNSELKNKTVLRPYQKRWANDSARLAYAVKAAQIGYSTASAAAAVNDCLRRPRTLWVFLSRSERQSLELAEKAKQWVDGYRGVVAELVPNQYFGATETLQHEIRFPNKSRIIALAANPDTARGYTGHVVLDEFAFHKDAHAIWRAAYRQTTLGYKVRVLSTPNGQQGMFYELAKCLKLDLGIRPRRQPVRAANREWGVGSREGRILSLDSLLPAPDSRSSPWSGHWCDIHLAVEEGAPIKMEEIRAGCDEDTWLQEYCCQFIAQGSQWISPELFQQCVSSEASVQLPDVGAGLRARPGQALLSPSGAGGQAQGPAPTELYAGWDIARKRDLSVIWICELLGDVTRTRGVIALRNMPTPDQVREARALMPFIRRINIDQSGMGLAIFEQLQREFPDKVEGVEFSAPAKEAMAVLAKRRMEETKVRVPDDAAVRRSFMSVKKSVNALGQARFDAGHDLKYGHADHWWAFCLAEAAAEQPKYSLDDGVIAGRPRDEELMPMEAESVF